MAQSEVINVLDKQSKGITSKEISEQTGLCIGTVRCNLKRLKQQKAINIRILPNMKQGGSIYLYSLKR